jgi:hypothetical protein
MYNEKFWIELIKATFPIAQISSPTNSVLLVLYLCNVSL